MAIYLDYAATTPVDPAVAGAMSHYLTIEGDFGNPSSIFHSHGRRARDAVEGARAEVARLVVVSPGDVFFLSGATEANNLAIKGIARGASERGRHIVTMATEHKAVIGACKALQREGFEVTFLRPGISGILDLASLRESIRPDTILVSVMHVNNETGIVQNLRAIAEVVGETQAFLHVDAAQSVGKLPIDLSRCAIDLLSLSAHKFYGPKGIGALVVRRNCRPKLVPLIDGGGQEGGLRSGTMATHQIVAMGEAARLAAECQQTDLRHVASLSGVFIDELSKKVSFVLNGSRQDWYPGILSISFDQVEAFALLNALPDVSASASSACSTGTLEPSHVLRAMGIEGDRLYGAVRFSFGRFTTEVDVRIAAQRVAVEVERIRALAAA
jgi:cysteine desulfurase